MSPASPSWRSLELGFAAEPSLFLAKSLMTSSAPLCHYRSVFGSKEIPFLFLLCLATPETACYEELCILLGPSSMLDYLLNFSFMVSGFGGVICQGMQLL